MARASLRVVVLVDWLAAGGGERAAVDIAKRLAGSNTVVLVASRQKSSDVDNSGVAGVIAELETSGVGVVLLGRTSIWKLWEWRPLVRLLRHGSVDVLHSHKLGSNFWAALLGRVASVPVVIAHEHTPFVRSNGVARFVNRHVVGRLATRIIVVSEWSRRQLSKGERIPLEKLIVIPNGIESVQARRTRADVRRELGIQESDDLVISVGMLRPEKGHDVLIRSVAHLARIRPRIRVLIVGGPDTQRPRDAVGEIMVLSEKLGVDEHVRLLGRRNDVPELLEAADVAVSSSRLENMPLSVLEYLASGTPTVATDTGGVSEVLADRVHGRLVPPDAPDAMANAIEEILSNPLQAQEMALAGQRRATSEFSLETTAARVESLYRQLCG